MVAKLRKKIGVEIQKYPNIENSAIAITRTETVDKIEKSYFFMDEGFNWMGFTKFKDGNPDFENSFYIPVSGFLQLMRQGYLYRASYTNKSFYKWEGGKADLPYFDWGLKNTKDMTPFVFQSVYSKSKPFMNWDETPWEVKL